MPMHQDVITCQAAALEQTLHTWWERGARLISCTPIVWHTVLSGSTPPVASVLGDYTTTVSRFLLVFERDEVRP